MDLVTIRHFFNKGIFYRRRRKQFQQATSYWQSIQYYEDKHRQRLLALAKKQVSPPRLIHFESRPFGKICCSHCWTVQAAERNFCAGYHCQTKFVFKDETV